MVIRNGLFGLVLVMFTVQAYAVSADDLRSFSADADREQKARASRANTADPAAQLPAQEKPANREFRRADDTAGQEPSQRRGREARGQARPSGQRRYSESEAVQVVPQNSGYQAPVSADKAFVNDAVPVMKNFGVRLGTWLEGNINRNTSSAEPGMVEIHLTEDVIGDRRTLKAGTLLFADKQINGQTKRLEMVIRNGITPAGEEFKITGLVFDLRKVSGLAGIITVNNDESVKRGAGKGLLAGLGAAAQNAVGQTPLGAAVGAGSQSILQDKGNQVDQETEQKLTVYVSPQPLLIRVEKTF